MQCGLLVAPCSTYYMHDRPPVQVAILALQALSSHWKSQMKILERLAPCHGGNASDRCVSYLLHPPIPVCCTTSENASLLTRPSGLALIYMAEV
jgi:hypothetical protein